jgi:hypothetical protein
MTTILWLMVFTLFSADYFFRVELSDEIISAEKKRAKVRIIFRCIHYITIGRRHFERISPLKKHLKSGVLVFVHIVWVWFSFLSLSYWGEESLFRLTRNESFSFMFVLRLYLSI